MLSFLSPSLFKNNRVKKTGISPGIYSGHLPDIYNARSGTKVLEMLIRVTRKSSPGGGVAARPVGFSAGPL